MKILYAPLLIVTLFLVACDSQDATEPASAPDPLINESAEESPAVTDEESGETAKAGNEPIATLGANYDLKPTWTGETWNAQFVAMRDGVRIAVDVLLPEKFTGEGEVPAAFPVIFEYTPYHRSNLDVENDAVMPNPLRSFFLSHGYAYVSADFRGTGASFGYMNQFSEAIRKDAREIIDWIAAQPWSDGNVGMWGGSYVGWSQMAAASQRPEALKAIIPNVIGWDRHLVKPGGVPSDAFTEIWSAFVYGLHRNQPGLVFDEDRGAAPPVPPVIDEDGDGGLADEIPVDADGSGWFHDDYAWPVDSNAPPRYADGVERSEHVYFNAVMEHEKHPDGAPGTFEGTKVIVEPEYWDTPRPGDGTITAEHNFGLLPAIAQSGVAIYNVAGWWDGFTRSSLQIFATLKDSNPSRVAVWPKYHQGLSAAAATALGVADEDLAYRSKDMHDQLRWYDRWLKGIDNGIDSEPPVQIYVVNGEGWRGEQEWPLAREKRVAMHLLAGGGLAPEAPAEAGSVEYRADLTHGSAWGPPLDAARVAEINALRPKPAPAAGTFGRNRYQMMGVPDTPPVRTEIAEKTLTFTSEPFSKDTEITGHPIVNIWVSSTVEYGDLFFYLEDLDDQGNAMLMTEHPHRAGFQTLVDDDLVVPNNPGIDVKPDLPWHGFREEDYTDRVFADGNVVNVTTDLLPVSWLVRKGHRIRLSVAAADWPTFALHPKLSPANDPGADDTIWPTLTFHVGPDRPSFVDLPVIDAGSD